MAASVPELIEIMMITAATPMITPNMVSKERSLFLVNPLEAIRMTLLARMVHLL